MSIKPTSRPSSRPPAKPELLLRRSVSSTPPKEIKGPTFTTYRVQGGKLTVEDFTLVRQYSFNAQEYQEAFDALFKIGFLPAQKDVEMAANLLGVLGDRVPRGEDGVSPDPHWLLREAFLLRADFPDLGSALTAFFNSLGVRPGK